MKHNNQGVAAVELALILPLLLLLSFTVTEFGRALYEYNTLTKSVRDAVRYLSVQNPTILTTDPGKVAIARNLVVYGSYTYSNTSIPLAVGLNLQQVPNPVWQINASHAPPLINTVTIKVTGYVFQPLVASIFGVNFGNITFADISATMRCPL